MKRTRKLYPRFHKDGSRCTLLSDYPEVAKEWDFCANDYGPENYLPTSSYKARWLCPDGHHYEAIIGKRTQRGDGCPFCSGRRVLEGFNDLLTKEPALAFEWHPNKNDLMPYEVTVGSRRRVWWLCPDCGYEYQAEIANRAIHHSGCPRCGHGKALAIARAAREKKKSNES